MTYSLEDILRSLALQKGHGAVRGRLDVKAFTAAVGAGANTGQALRQAGLDRNVADAIDASRPKDPALALRRLALAVDRASRHRRSLRAVAFYPLAIAIAALALSLAAPQLMAPVLTWVPPPHDLTAAAAGWTNLGTVATGVVAALLFTLTATALGGVGPVDLIAAIRRTYETHFGVEGLAGILEAGAPLPQAVRAMAKLLADGQLTAGYAQWAENLEHPSNDPDFPELFGDYPAEVFVALAGRGAATQAASAAASFLAAQGRFAWPADLVRARWTTHAVAGLALAIAAGHVLLTYAGGLPG